MGFVGLNPKSSRSPNLNPRSPEYLFHCLHSYTAQNRRSSEARTLNKALNRNPPRQPGHMWRVRPQQRPMGGGDHGPQPRKDLHR